MAVGRVADQTLAARTAAAKPHHHRPDSNVAALRGCSAIQLAISKSLTEMHGEMGKRRLLPSPLRPHPDIGLHAESEAKPALQRHQKTGRRRAKVRKIARARIMR
jgi:hypothetical protein